MKNPDYQRDKLVNLGPETLADTLLDLSSRSDDAAAVVERMTSSPKENQKRFKSKLAGLKRQRKFIDWRGAADFARRLEELLADLRAGVQQPQTGVELAAAFFECDKSVFERCDDSNGAVGDVFRFDARQSFIHYASQVDDKEWLCQLLLKLYEHDDYGVRGELLDSASEFLPTDSLRSLAEVMWEQAEQEHQIATDTWHFNRWFYGVKTLARQLKDAPLFEKAALTSAPEKPLAVCIDIAEVYLESGDAARALSILKDVPKDNPHFETDRDALLLAAYKKLGNNEKAAETAWRIFRRQRGAANLDVLLEVVGSEKRQWIIDQQAQEIHLAERLDYASARFLMEVDQTDEAETYILHRAGQLNGGLYELLVPLAKRMEESQHLLGATAIYRALLESILARALSRYYHHGVRYLRKLDDLAPEVSDWRNLAPHASYKAGLLEVHARKKSFWAKYETSS
ncbi:MAG: hypothetical protein M1309_05625 [Actinobacteria bacterium]|nr:hypothetical protein [Actinomycetota bacterium]